MSLKVYIKELAYSTIKNIKQPPQKAAVYIKAKIYNSTHGVMTSVDSTDRQAIY